MLIFLRGLAIAPVASVVAAMIERLEHMVTLGLDYLGLARARQQVCPVGKRNVSKW
ncbi:hypothetical protein [Candidatus Symbiopectobacterium sp.]|uniref:hypothetical protein n=1 Tax=Candidatus Symbiopectobacterium sp. TaxID=2816440 RepID=UPI0025BB42C1|nr:hypothetical protein [Candidatus Symbiopectobacterium sp.]